MKHLTALLCIIFLFNITESKAEGISHPLQEAQFYFLIDADTKEVLLSKNADLRLPPSSMTKLMTAYVVFDQVKKGKVSFANQCLIGRDAWRKSGSSMFLNYGDVVSIEELLKGLLAVSGNDAAIALAETTAHGYSNFINLMNSKAKELGMTNSHFKNPHGLYETDHYMSLRDLATLTMRIYQDFPEYSHYLGIMDFTYRNITQHTRNPLLKRNYDGAIGGKTGHTNEGGYGVVGIVKRDNRRLVAVVNKARTPNLRTTLIVELMDYGFDHYKKIEIFRKDETVATVQTWLGKNTQVDAITAQNISFNIPRDRPISNVKVRVKYQSPIYAPIKQGDKVATLVVEVKGYKNFEYPLLAKESVDKAGTLRRINQTLHYKISNFLK
jgi:D-alanyl-D-alanine carboxypeptidase (penicillin-binding protein 5/6)